MTTEILKPQPAPQTAQQPSWLERTFHLTSVQMEVAAYVLIVLLSIITHLWQLDKMAMHHDESIHAWASWRYYSGHEGFNCYSPPGETRTSASYCYDPVYHGPSLYMLTLVSYFLFGDGDAQARLPMAVAGVLMVASCWMFRPLLGRRGALIAAVLLAFSPSLLYYTRFARHDGLMVLWEVWLVASVFRYLDTGKVGYLYLLSASLALIIGTHELYYILFFIFGIFTLMRLATEIQLTDRFMNAVLLILIGICLVFIVINPPLPVGKGLYLGEKAFLVGMALLTAWLCQRVWTHIPFLRPRLYTLVTEQRTHLYIAIGIFVSLYLVMYTNFFSYPRGALDGLYAGLAYWLGSQQEYARGDQPWYYYLMQLPLYEPIAVLSALGAGFYLFTRKGLRGQEVEEKVATPPLAASQDEPSSPANSADASEDTANNAHDGEASEHGKQPYTGETVTLNKSSSSSWLERLYTPITPPNDVDNQESPAAKLFPLLLIFWLINATIIFSWAGEKMPWLLVHMSLPGNLLAAWVFGKLFANLDIANANERERLKTPMRLIPFIVFLLIISLGVAIWRIQGAGDGQEEQSQMLQGLFPLLIGGGLIYSLLTIGQRTGVRIVLSLSALTIAAILGAYTIRATWLVVYDHPDVAIEPLIYTQSSPDVPRYVEDFKELSINLTRNLRSEKDVTGEWSMPIIADNGGSGSDGSLAWPFQWYLRHFRNVSWKKADDFKEPNRNTFTVNMPDGTKGLAPVLMIYKSHITNETLAFLNQHYVAPYGEGGSLNWWFPEGNKCAPLDAGYKKYYFHSWVPKSKLIEHVEKDCGNDISADVHPPWAPLLWPFDPDNWDTLKDYVLYRELPEPLKPGSRDMQVWVRNDLLQGLSSDTETVASGTGIIHLFAEDAFGSGAELSGPTSVTVGDDGKVYVADTLNHRIQVYDRQGNLLQTIGSYGKGEGQFDQPRGIAVDDEGFIYVADTWNARIVKLTNEGEWVTSWGSGDEKMPNSEHIAMITGGTQESNQANPLGFFGPRGIALDDDGNVYIADTGNKRIVVTDNAGNYLYQWGYSGSGNGKFNEPTGVAIDDSGNVYVADTWNGRVQIFAPGSSGQVEPVPVVVWDVSGWLPDTYEDPSITVSGDGTVYVSVPSRHYVAAATMRGDVLLRWGGTGTDLASLNAPSGMAVGPDGGVYVVDREQNRVLHFNLPRTRASTSSGGGG
jgi:uncharacterized protein (TIGR03663 family)